MLRVDTIGKVNPIGKPHVYFAARKEDYGYLNSVTSNLFMAANVAVYYDDQKNSKNTETAELLRMNVIVVILTEELLKSPSDVMTRIFPLAIKNGIPLMILGMTDNVGFLLDDFCEKNHLGNHHVIFPNKKDPGRTFLTKLKDFLAEHAFGNTDRKKIEQALDGRIFLSYRKVDKSLASQVIALLNDAKSCLSYGLWYDDYLTAGEDFDEEIQTALDASDVFLLLLTKAMLQKGSYALEREYARAVEEEKTIVVLDVIEGSHTLPEELDEGDPILLYGDAIDELPGLMVELMGKRERTTKWEKADQNYHLGLAYQRGIYKNRDENIAVDLIREAATAGHMDACDAMVKICADHYDLASARDWQQVLTNHFATRFQREQSLDALDRYLHHLNLLGEYHGMQEDYEGMKKCYQSAQELLDRVEGWDTDPRIIEYAIIAADKLGTFAQIELSSAEDKASQLDRIEEYYNRSFEYAKQFMRFEHSLKANRFWYTPLMRLTDLNCEWSNIPLEDIWENYYNILKMMLKTDEEFSSYETLCDLSGCYKTLTKLSEQLCADRTLELSLCWLERARQAYLTSRHLERCAKYAEAMEYTARLQYAAGDLAEAIRNLNKATKARIECITGNQKLGVNVAPDVVALFNDYVNDAHMQLRAESYDNAALCLKGAEDALLAYPDVLRTKRNLMTLEHLRQYFS